MLAAKSVPGVRATAECLRVSLRVKKYRRKSEQMFRRVLEKRFNIAGAWALLLSAFLVNTSANGSGN